ncbi:MAG: thymidylate kinase [Oscillospiraceae bacterium]|nr:thymidylate kinase [Oscillospiraceae bacterium]MCR4759451.1 thymidylate kinase [Oscillospiraceae bacterium]
MGKLIVLEGLDGSGKGTQATELFRALGAEGKKVLRVSFPNYGSDAAKMLDDYLHGAFGNDPADVNPYAASTFFAVDRYASYHQNWKQFYLDGGIIIADRYTTANAIHQCAKLPQADWDAFLEWLFTYEYQLLGLPAPDAVFYLRVDPEVSQKLLAQRYAGDEQQKDIHESNLQYQEQCRTAADYCAARLGWHVIECVKHGGMRTVPEIAAEIRSLLPE